ncbi:hypothetical protein ABEB36_012523 [Hypothenemus hampei]|uniref:Uncharacterized protein n=1 Tax=Hypothenemus hampei TaxID=57062 RepID=A0ABD1EE93_HYPHA
MVSTKSFFKSVRKYFREYCDLSTIHGMKYIGENRTTVERGWWLTVFLFSVTCCFYLIYLVYEKWDSSPVIISLANEETPIYQIPFPAVTICPLVKSFSYNQTAIRSKLFFAQPLSKTEHKSFSYMNFICDHVPYAWFDIKIGNFSVYENFFNKEEFYNFIHNITTNKYFLDCRWQNQDFYCNNFFDTILTDDGVCHSFNLLSPKKIYKDNVQNYFFDRTNSKIYNESSSWSLDRGFSHDKGSDTYPRREPFSGAINGLEVMLYMDYPLRDIYCKSSWTFEGYKVILHTPSTVPRPNQEHFYLPPNTAVIAAIKPVVVNTSEKVKSFRPEKRNCYFENENPLKYFKDYTQKNCELDCLTRHTLHLCGCVAFYMPMDSFTPLCGTGKNECMKAAKKRMLSKELKWRLENADDDQELPHCHCLPSCRDLSYEVETSSSSINSNPDSKFPRSRLVIYFKKNHFIASIRHELYGITDFISNFGGLLGLFTGFSMLSFIEIIYFLTVRLFYNFRLYGQWSGKKDEESNL